MSIWHDIALPDPLITESSGDELRLSLPEGPSAAFLLITVSSLTRRSVAEVLDRAEQVSPRRVFIAYAHSSAEGRDALRRAGISFAGGDGRLFVRAPGIFLDRDDRARSSPNPDREPTAGDATRRNPFSNRSSRVPRWLLLHHEEAFSLGELATAVDVHPSAVSRVIRTLEDAAFVHASDPSAVGGRRRRVRLDRPRTLLDTWLPLWQRRRVCERAWDIGARDADEALARLREVAATQPSGWAIGGLAGAALTQRVVEPADVFVWASIEASAALSHALQPESARRARGVVRVALTPDPWILGLTRSLDGLPVADRAQLWLDCASDGERALEAADAIAAIAGWS
jgi:DNA-binding transcriptional ArsR family regulator